MSALAAAALLTIIGLIGILGRAGLGFIGDKLHNNVTLAIGFILVALVFLAITISGTIHMLYVYAVIYGLFSGVGLLLASINAEHFGLQSLERLQAQLSSATISAARWGLSSPGLFTTRTAITGWPFYSAGS